jgi:hypothetical protein
VISAALALIVLTLFFNLMYLAVAPPLAEEEHFQLGEHLHATGVLSINDTPAFFRPPGFPVFVAMVLHLRDALAPGVDGRRAVALAHGGLLSLGAVALFLHTSRGQPVPIAFAAGVLYAFHPLSLFIARVLTYYLLHIVLVTIATLALSHALRSGRRRLAWGLAAGLLWGVATVVRPVSLLLPPFILLLARWVDGKGAWRRSLAFTSLFTLGMALVVSPVTLRNYRLSHRLVVVNAQDGYAFWGLSASRNPGGDIAEWAAMWREHGEPIFKRVSGGAAYSIEALYENPVALNDAFRAEAGRNIREHPGRFAANVLGNLLAFNVDSSHRWLDRLDYVREGWDWPPRAALAKLFNAGILVLALVGVVRGLRAGDTHARAVAAIYAMFLVAHCMVILLTRYTYVRLPLVLVAFPLALRGIERNPVATRALWIAAAVATASVWELSVR